MKLKAADAIIKMLEHEGVTLIFGYPGAANCPIYDSLSRSNIKHILMRQEQSCAHAASGYARISEKVGVCMSTSGPGATNLITGIATAYADSIPLVAITGQVSTSQIGKDVFQEVDITGAAAPFCKHSYLVKDAKILPQIIHEAFYIANSGRPGPVLIDIPVDIQNTEIEFKEPREIVLRGYKPTYEGHDGQIKKIADIISESSKPVICAGGGVITSNASEELIKISEICGIPVTNTLMGKGCIPETHENYLGMIGYHGVSAANNAVYESDLIIVMGARAADRATRNSNKFGKKAKIVHIDIDPAEIGKNLTTNIPIVGNLKTILNQIIKVIDCEYKSDWINIVRDWRKPKEFSMEESCSVNPKYVLTALSELTRGNAIVSTEVGQHQIWAANNYNSIYPRRFLTSGGLGTMGYGLPAAIGAKLADKSKKVIAITGDGSFQMNMQEMAAIKQWGADVIIILFNNGSLGMVREIQKNSFERNYYAIDLSGSPDFLTIASAYGIEGTRVTSNKEVKEVLEKAVNEEGSYFIEFIVDPEEVTL